jgi:hypothetical protein
LRKSSSGNVVSGPIRPGQRALVERHAGQDADAALQARRQELVLRALVEDVVDDLHGVDDAGLDQPERVGRLVVVDRHAEEADLALVLERLDDLEPVALAHPVVAPDVQLLQVDRVRAEVAERAFGAAAHPLAGKRLVGARPSGAGHIRFFGGTLVATWTVSDRPRTTCPTSCSLCPRP